jgi:hypothetical protein
MHGSLPLVSASADIHYDLGSQLWNGHLPIHIFLVPLVIKGHQQTCTQFLSTSAQGSSLSGSILSRIQALYLTKNVCRGKLWSGLEPGSNLLPKALEPIFTCAPIMRPTTFLILSCEVLSILPLNSA